MRRSATLSAGVLALAALAAAPPTVAAAAPEPAARADLATLDYRLQARALAPGVYVVEGTNADFSPANGCNIINTGFIVTGAGVVVVNTGPSKRYGEQLRALIARTTREPVVQVIHLNQHPDYFLGNQAFADVPRRATPRTRAGMAREVAAYADNLYRLCGDWMRDTEAGTPAMLPAGELADGVLRVGHHELELRELQGHTGSDLVLVDRASGVAFVGGLVFAQRVPTTPHAQIGAWQASLRDLRARPFKVLVPSHGPVAVEPAAIGTAIDGTQRFLAWIDSAFSDAARRGLEMNEVLRLPVPAEFRQWAAFDTEYVRNVAHLYPRYEQAQLRRQP